MSILGNVVGTAATLVGSGINAISQGKLNKKTIQYNKDMYALQRADALKDWNMQNDYNNPASQMSRLKAAGLNPNLVYGNGADTTSGPVRSSSAGSWNPNVPNYGDIPKSLGKYFVLKEQQLQMDNLKAQNTVILQDAALKEAQRANVNAATQQSLAQTGKIGIDTDTGKFDLGLKSDLRDISLEAARAQLDKTQTEIGIALSKNEREAAINSQNLEIGAQKILNMRMDQAKTADERKVIQQQLENLKNNHELQDLDLQLKRIGVQPGDNLFMRMLGRIIGSAGGVQAAADSLENRYNNSDFRKRIINP